MFKMEGAKSVTPDQWLKDGDEVQVGGLSFRVVEAPGHSPGHIVFFNEANKFALMGDVLFQNSVGRTDLPGGSHETLIKNIKTKILPLGDDDSAVDHLLIFSAYIPRELSNYEI